MQTTASITKNQPYEITATWSSLPQGEQYLSLRIRTEHLEGSFDLFIDESQLPRLRKALATKKGFKRNFRRDE